jgi:hypothetical protein
MATSSNPITQVSQTPIQHVGLQPHLVSRLLLDLRGQRFSVDRETIMNLPESVLLCLFPNGLVLSRNSALLDPTENEEDEEVYGVDVRRVTEAPASRLAHSASSSLTHSASTTSSSFSKSRESTSMAHKTSQMASSSCSSNTSTLSTTPFLPSRTPCSPNRPSLSSVRSWNISLSLLTGSTAGTDKDGTPNDDLNDLKRECGQRLLEKRNIFTALQRNVNKENNMAEQHLIDMLCVRYAPNLQSISFPFMLIVLQWL